MAKLPFPEGRTPRIVAGSLAAMVAMTFGVAASGLFREDLPKGAPSSRPAGQPGATKPLLDERSETLQLQAAGVSVPEGFELLSAPKPGAAAQSQPTFTVKRVLDITQPLHHGDYVWDDAGVPDGPIVITVDLKAQTLSVFRDGYEIGVAVILYGADDKKSPVGVYPILQKNADHYSNLYNNAPMPYMLRLTWDGVAVHGSDVIWGEATHGCIGVPTAFAKKLFGQAKLGDIVIITDGKMMDLG